jgi:hypothetical protein
MLRSGFQSAKPTTDFPLATVDSEIKTSGVSFVFCFLFFSVESEDLVQQNKVRKIPTMNSQQDEAKQASKPCMF